MSCLKGSALRQISELLHFKTLRRPFRTLLDKFENVPSVIIGGVNRANTSAKPAKPRVSKSC